MITPNKTEYASTCHMQKLCDLIDRVAIHVQPDSDTASEINFHAHSPDGVADGVSVDVGLELVGDG